MNMQTTAPARFVKYVRVRSESDARFVEFDFAINDPSLFVELIMPTQRSRVYDRRASGEKR